MHFTFVGAGEGTTVLDGRVVAGPVIILASNDGKQAGAIIAAQVAIEWSSAGRRHSISAPLLTPNSEPVLVGPGGASTVRLFLPSRIFLEAGTGDADARALVTPRDEARPLDAPFESATCKILAEVANASGKIEDFVIIARCTPLHPLLKDMIQGSVR